MVEAKFNILPDPLGDRAVKTMEPPPNKPLETRTLFPNSGNYKE
jgi:hypothetical protein